MAVYKRSYKTYEGTETARWGRFLIPARYGFSALFRSKLLWIFLAFSLFYPLMSVGYIYLAHNPTFALFGNMIRGAGEPVDGAFFYHFCAAQGFLAYLATAVVAPNLITFDLANGALPLYFCRPFSRFEYLLGKMTVLLSLLSLITWIPGLCLFAVEAAFGGWGWVRANYWMPAGLMAGLLVWIFSITLLGFALSTIPKSKVIAGALVLGFLFVGAGFGGALNLVLQTHAGTLLNLNQVAHAIWAELFRFDANIDLNLGAAWAVLGLLCALSLALLARRVRPFEIIS